MKYVKVTITKTRTEKETKFVYPKGYDATKFNVICYQNEWLDSEFCIATMPDDFVASEWLEEINQWQAKQLVDDFIKADKDMNEVKLTEIWKSRASIIKNKQNNLWKS